MVAAIEDRDPKITRILRTVKISVIFFNNIDNAVNHHIQSFIAQSPIGQEGRQGT